MPCKKVDVLIQSRLKEAVGKLVFSLCLGVAFESLW